MKENETGITVYPPPDWAPEVAALRGRLKLRQRYAAKLAARRKAEPAKPAGEKV